MKITSATTFTLLSFLATEAFSQTTSADEVNPTPTLLLNELSAAGDGLVVMKEKACAGLDREASSGFHRLVIATDGGEEQDAFVYCDNETKIDDRIGGWTLVWSNLVSAEPTCVENAVCYNQELAIRQ